MINRTYKRVNLRRKNESVESARDRLISVINAGTIDPEDILLACANAMSEDTCASVLDDLAHCMLFGCNKARLDVIEPVEPAEFEEDTFDDEEDDEEDEDAIDSIEVDDEKDDNDEDDEPSKESLKRVEMKLRRLERLLNRF